MFRPIHKTLKMYGCLDFYFLSIFILLTLFMNVYNHGKVFRWWLRVRQNVICLHTILYLIFARLDESPFYRANTSANIGLGTRSMSFLNVTVTNEARLLGQEKMAHFCHSLARSSLQRRAQITWRVNVLAAGESLIICYLLVVTHNQNK